MKNMRKLTPYQERLAHLRADLLMSESQIAKLSGKALGTIKNEFIKIRQILEIPTFEEAYRKYKKSSAAPVTSHETECAFKPNEISGL